MILLEQRLLDHLKLNPFILAPMAGITDRPFRSFMREMGCGVVVTELVSATGFKYSPEKTKRLMQFEPTQHPVGIQLFGDNLEHLSETAKAVEQMGADFVDINFGCPVPKVVKKGAGSACLKDLAQLRNTIRAVKTAVQIPVTIKIRTGWDANSRNSHEVVQIAHDEGVTWVAIHGRTRAEGYSGQSDWEYIREVKLKSPVAIIGNGDICSPSKAVERLQESGCDGVMIGRGCLKNPFLFEQARGISTESGLVQVLARLHEHLETFYNERLTLIQMKKFAAWYSSGFPGAGAFRRNLFQLQDRNQVLACIEQFFREVNFVRPEDTSNEPFLMGGHG